MELGGKSPVLIFEDADIERALDAALFTIFSINGERCTAGSRIFIQQSIYPEFVKRFAERANRLRVGDPTDPNTQIGALISQQHWEKVSGYIRLGIEEGATLLAGGADKPSDLPAHLKAGNFLRPTVLADVDNRMRVAQKRFLARSPACCRSKTKRKGYARRTMEYGPASYIWTRDVSKVLRLARGIEAGMVFVNTQNVRDLRQPFGGVKASGTGREGGEYSFEVFAEMKTSASRWATIRSRNGESDMGKLALAAKITHVPSMYLSELPGKNHGCRQARSTGIKKLASAAVKWASIPLSCLIPTGWSTAPTTSTAPTIFRASTPVTNCRISFAT